MPSVFLATVRVRAKTRCVGGFPLGSRKYSETSCTADAQSREELLAKVKDLEQQISRLQSWNETSDYSEIPKYRKSIAFTEENCRFVALKVAYLGWKYSGYQRPGYSDPLKSIEGQLRVALDRVRLVEHPATAVVAAASRTDAGVSALDQVVKVYVRSRQRHSQESDSSSSREAHIEEFDYVNMLNRALPNDIRVLAWAPVRNDFNPRMDPEYKTYWYIFQRADLDIERMRLAAVDFVGKHNFQNLCVWSLSPSGKVRDFVRTINAVAIDALPWETLVEMHGNSVRMSTGDPLSEQAFDSNEGRKDLGHERETLLLDVSQSTKKVLPPSDDLFVLKVRGKSFLYKQVRCMAGALFAIGRGLESGSFIRDLLTVGESDRKIYTDYAPPESLFLHEIKYSNLSWHGGREMLSVNFRRAAAIQALQLWNSCELIQRVSSHSSPEGDVNPKYARPHWLGRKSREGGTCKYQSVLERPRGLLVEEFKKKKKDKRTVAD